MVTVSSDYRKRWGWMMKPSTSWRATWILKNTVRTAWKTTAWQKQSSAVQRQNMAPGQTLVSRVTYANGDAAEGFTDAEAFLKCVREELPYRPTIRSLRYEVVTGDPAVRKGVDDIVFDLYGEEIPASWRNIKKCPIRV